MLSCLNYLVLPQALNKNGLTVGGKISETMKEMGLVAQGPIWNSMLQACQSKALKKLTCSESQESNDKDKKAPIQLKQQENRSQQK